MRFLDFTDSADEYLLNALSDHSVAKLTFFNISITESRSMTSVSGEKALNIKEQNWFIQHLSKGWRPYPNCHAKRQIDICEWVGFYWHFNVAALWRFINLARNRKFSLWRLSSTKHSQQDRHSSLPTHLVTHRPSPFPRFYVTLERTRSHRIEIKSTFNTRRNRVVENRDH